MEASPGPRQEDGFLENSKYIIFQAHGRLEYN